MNTPVAAAPLDRHAAYNKGRLFMVSILALFTAGLAASLRSSAASELQRIFFDPIDKAHSAEMIGDLTLYMNKVRQAAITREIIEVVSGAEAL